MTKRKAIVDRDRTVHTYMELWHASECVLELGERQRSGSAFQFLSSIVLTAFALEACLNHVGPRVLSSWSGLERSSPLSKLDLLCEVLKVQLLGKDQRPQQTISKLFTFRNTLAHGRTEVLEPAPERIAVEEVDDYLRRPLLTNWEKLIEDSSFARRAREDVEAVVMAIHAARPEPKERHPFTFGGETCSAIVGDT
jgi:hypothetical protein